MVNLTLDSISTSTAVVAKPCGRPSCNVKLQKEQQIHRIKRPQPNEQLEDDQLLQTYEVLDGYEVEKQRYTNKCKKMMRCLSLPLGSGKDVPD
ncbi:unnamed protein product, partial [Didymodactylos carnosus]